MVKILKYPGIMPVVHFVHLVHTVHKKAVLFQVFSRHRQSWKQKTGMAKELCHTRGWFNLAYARVPLDFLVRVSVASNPSARSSLVATRALPRVRVLSALKASRAAPASSEVRPQATTKS